MACKERPRLAGDYGAAVRIYWDLVSELVQMIELELAAEVALVHRACKLALENAQRAREQLLRHEVDHNCSQPT
jgi:hypothetical protein